MILYHLEFEMRHASVCELRLSLIGSSVALVFDEHEFPQQQQKNNNKQLKP